MNKVIIVDTSDSDCRLMSGLITRAGYEPVIAEDMEAARQEVAKLSPGAVFVTAMKLRGALHKRSSLSPILSNKFTVLDKIARFLSNKRCELTKIDRIMR